MTHERPIRRVLIYKRTHEGDPDPGTGIFGNKDCMGIVRSRTYDVVIGIGGAGREAETNGIARRLTWLGIGPHKRGNDPERPEVAFDHFLYYLDKKPMLRDRAPALARRMYDGSVRMLMAEPSSPEWQEVKTLLDLARNAPPSGQLDGPAYRNSKQTGGKCRSRSCRRKSVDR